MKIANKQTRVLLNLLATSKPDQIDCDGCHEHMSEIVEYELLGSEIPEALFKAEVHLDQCACCNDERNALMTSLLAVED